VIRKWQIKLQCRPFLYGIELQTLTFADDVLVGKSAEGCGQFPIERHNNTLMMEAASTSETSVNVYQTTPRNIPEDSHLQYEAILKQDRIISSYRKHHIQAFQPKFCTYVLLISQCVL
jgi:hypothetical protein